MTNLLEPGAESAGNRPAYLPEKFWDSTTNQPRLEALARSYAELEKRLGGNAGAPASPRDYRIVERHPLCCSDDEVNQRLHGAGFSQEQAQLVYDLAHERLLPTVQHMAQEFESRRQIDKLVQHFGSRERWLEVSRQLGQWGQANLPPDLFEALASSFEGIVALERMMQSGEPAIGAQPSKGDDALGEKELRQMIADPRYWRDQDPTFMARVTEGYKRLFPGSVQY